MRKLKTLLLGLLLASTSRAGSVTLSGTLYYPFTDVDGSLATCTATIRLNAIGSTNSVGQDFGSTDLVYKIRRGVYNFTLQANDALTPAGTSYSVAFSACDRPKTWNETWIVPTSPNPTTIGAVRVPVAASPSLLLPFSASGLTTGTYCVNVVNGVFGTPALIPCSSAPPPSLTLALLTDLQLLTLTNTQLAVIGN